MIRAQKTLQQICCLIAVIFVGFYLTRDQSLHVCLFSEGHRRRDEDNKTHFSDEKPQCLERSKIIFAKTHKTGSTTVQNILFRFGQEHQLLFVLPKSGTHKFNLTSHFTSSMADLHEMYSNVRSEFPDFSSSINDPFQFLCVRRPQSLGRGRDLVSRAWGLQYDHP